MNPVLRVQIIDKDDKVIAESRDFVVADKAWDLIDDSLGVKHKVKVSEDEVASNHKYMRTLKNDHRRLKQENEELHFTNKDFERENVRLDLEVDVAGKKILNLRERLGEKSRSNNELRKANAALQEECSDLREENIEMQDDIRQLSTECDHWKGLAGVYKRLAGVVDEKALAEAMSVSGVIDQDILNSLREGKYMGTSPHFKGPRGNCKCCKRNTYSKSDGE